VIACNDDDFRFRVLLNSYGKMKSISFGSNTEKLFIDDGDTISKRIWINNRLRSTKNLDVISGLIVCPFLFEYYILFGDSDNIIDNIISLNKMLLNKYQSCPVWLYFD